jgi:hypothetical protein
LHFVQAAAPAAPPVQPTVTKAAFKLRRSIQPKNPVLLLNELLGSTTKVIYEYLDVPLG